MERREFNTQVEKIPNMSISFLSDSPENIDVFSFQADRYPLLKPNQETIIFERLKAGWTLEDLYSDDELVMTITPDQTDKFSFAFVMCRDLRQFIICCNLRLVPKAIRPYLSRGLDYDDLMQVGFEALHKIVDKFDHNMVRADGQGRVKFSGFAFACIKQACSRALKKQTTTFSIPQCIKVEAGRMSKIRNSLAVEGINPSSSQLIQEYVEQAGENGKFAQEVYFLLSSNITYPASLEQTTGEYNDVPISTFIADPKADTAEIVGQKLTIEEFMEHFTRAFIKLTVQERKVLYLRQIYKDRRGLTLDEVAERIKTDEQKKPLTKERIRQIEVKALNKLYRDPTLRQFLEKYWDKELPPLPPEGVRTKHKV